MNQLQNHLVAMRQRSVQCISAHGLHRMAYTEWGDAANPRVVICVHGLTRTGRDFDFLAQALAQEYRVICPDVVGRGKSDWLAHKNDYALSLYVADMVTLIARLDVDNVHWVGTSMGGLIGMLLAGLPESPVMRLVLNDVGPVITMESLKRIGEYLGHAPKFADIEEAEKFLRVVSAPFGNLTDAQWRHLTVHATRSATGGGLEMAYDPGIAESFRQALVERDVNLWPAYDAIRCPTLLLRGAQSDLLLRETALEMGNRGPRAPMVEIPGVGHAPMLMDAPQIDLVRQFLLHE